MPNVSTMHTASPSTAEEPPPSYHLKQRKRNGSLRKTALLGTRKFRSDNFAHSSVSRSRRGSNSVRRELEFELDGERERERDSVLRATGLGLRNEDQKVRGDDPEKESVIVDGDMNSAVDDEGGSPELDQDEMLEFGGNVNKITSNASVSSTDEDDLLVFGTRKVSSVVSSSSPAIALPGNKPTIPSKFLSLPSSSSPQSSSIITNKSSLNFQSSEYVSPSTTTASATVPATVAESSDSTTAFYGYIILFLTWAVFITGLGSCLDIWSWAWDVGTTPPAPPELHDDETLPITGYYPALLILTGGVVSWVWCGFAWMGMKYFRHAKEGEG